MRKSTLTLTNGCLILLAFLSAGWIGVKPNNLPEPNIRPGAQNSGYSLRFYGNGVNDIDRVKIQIDDPANNNPGPPADVGATDFTLEFWMKASAAENNAAPIVCGNNLDWIYGNTLFDRDRFSQDRKFGLAIAGGVFVLGVTGEGPVDYTICGTTNVLDQTWYHVAVQRRRSDGWLWLYIDGQLEVEADGPDGDISYPDDGQPRNEPTYCGGICVNDPYLVIGAEKHDVDPSEYPSYSGWIDEVRLSTVLRYSANFTPSTQPFAPIPIPPHSTTLMKAAATCLTTPRVRRADRARECGSTGARQPARSGPLIRLSSNRPHRPYHQLSAALLLLSPWPLQPRSAGRPM